MPGHRCHPASIYPNYYIWCDNAKWIISTPTNVFSFFFLTSKWNLMENKKWLIRLLNPFDLQILLWWTTINCCFCKTKILWLSTNLAQNWQYPLYKICVLEFVVAFSQELWKTQSWCWTINQEIYSKWSKSILSILIMQATTTSMRGWISFPFHLLTHKA